eukprot:TRINITY_DN6904_c0_g1_i1.p1 TRINITY_DN6904_c0_g1~~TRINITY_DN6904_c0_g1_i1.p1  ORF type:complete len:335 (+),score=5.61 TRINITY_DN6904_c0_g1_i1:149-1153(+)
MLDTYPVFLLLDNFESFTLAKCVLKPLGILNQAWTSGDTIHWTLDLGGKGGRYRASAEFRVPSPRCLRFKKQTDRFQQAALYFTTEDDIVKAINTMYELSKVNRFGIPIHLVICADLPNEVAASRSADGKPHYTFSDSQRQSPLSHLPEEILFQILSYCGPAIRSTCKHFRDIFQLPHFQNTLLKIICQKRISATRISLRKDANAIKFWKKILGIMSNHYAEMDNRRVNIVRETFAHKVRRKKKGSWCCLMLILSLITLGLFTMLIIGTLISTSPISGLSLAFIAAGLTGTVFCGFLTCFIFWRRWLSERVYFEGKRRWRYKKSVCCGDYTACV